ncbi:MAG: DegT/DnrJ/EryC1/StrS family aminotransferase [Peptococcaceae bacterium]|jgi:dTDP-4-amino-4,6-dideoxygalactose transaminase|nr:DegT/DnrJ/EryC1/StrS family aminotransferase [Peptococcaceae bacterium]
MKVPLLNLAGQYLQLKKEIDRAVETVLINGSYIMGPQVNEFEKNIAEYLRVKHALGVASGSDALLLSLHALGVGKGDKVIVPTFTFFATAGAVCRLGAEPVFVDINPVSYNLDPEQVEDIINREIIKAIIPVHLFGLPCNMEKLMDLAEKYGIKVIEDACQAIGADVNYRGQKRKAGSIGDIGCFSFFPTKNLSCYGDGGLVATNDDALAEKIAVLRVHGSKPKYYHSVVGYNSRLDTIQAAVLNVKLKYLPEWSKKRRRVASLYNKAFEEKVLAGKITCPAIVDGHVFHQYVVSVDHRDKLAEFLKKKGIGTSVYYPLPLHLQECFKGLGYRPGDLPVSEAASQRVLALPIDPELNDEEINYVVDSIKEFLG